MAKYAPAQLLLAILRTSSNCSGALVLSVCRGPAPPEGTHRYAFLLFKQPNQEPLQVSDPSGGESMGRKGFNTRSFAEKHGLGHPVAATFFLSHK